MKGGRVFFYLFALILVMLIAVFLVWQKFLAPSATAQVTNVATPTPVDVIKVVFVSQRVTRGQELDASVLNPVQYPRNLFVEGMFTKVEDVIGKRAKFDIDSGVPLTAGMVSDGTGLSNVGSDWALSVPQGMVAISVPINRLSSISFAPSRGDHVNVLVSMTLVELDADFQTILPNASAAIIAPGGSILVGPSSPLQAGALTTSELLRTLGAQIVSGSTSSPVGRAFGDSTYNQTFYAVPSEGQRPRLVSQTLIQDVMVLQIGSFETTPAQSAAAAPAAGNTAPVQTTAVPTQVPQQGKATPTPVAAPKPDIITLIVTPQDAVTLNYLLFSGAKLTLVGRGANDSTRVQTEAVTLQYLLDQYNIPVPVKLPYGLEPRLDTVTYPVLPNDAPTPTPKP